MARAPPCHFKAILIKYEEGKEKVRTVWYGAVSVKLPGREERLFMVMEKGFDKEPTMLLTNYRINLRVKESI